jgi:hypothetical protein
MDVTALERLVEVLGPRRPPVHQLLVVLGPEPLGAGLAGDQYDMGTMVALVAFLVAYRARNLAKTCSAGNNIATPDQPQVQHAAPQPSG